MDAAAEASPGKREAAARHQLTRSRPLARHRRLRLPLGIRIQNQLAQLALRRGVDDGAEQGEAAALAVDVVLARRERDVASAAATAVALPDRKSNQLESFERPFAEMELGVGEF